MVNSSFTRFYTGLHQPSDAKHFDRCMVSVNRLESRKSDFEVNEWIMDSGAFTRISTGRGHMQLGDYANQIRRWKPDVAVSQDYMCEPFILKQTDRTVLEHQRMTIWNYRDLLMADTGNSYIMPVLQGYAPLEYSEHIRTYKYLDAELPEGAWVGVGSVCKRNGSPLQAYAVLAAIHDERPDLLLHGFGLQMTALSWSRITDLLYSADSMAWSYAARKQGRNGNDWREADRYRVRIEKILEKQEVINCHSTLTQTPIKRLRY